MSETPATYDCGAGCTCDAVTDLASERTELMDEMAAALVDASFALLAALDSSMPPSVVERARAARHRIRVVFMKYQGRGEASG